MFVDQSYTATTSKASSRLRVPASQVAGVALATNRSTKKVARTARSTMENPGIRLVTRVNDQHVFQHLFAADFLQIYLPSSVHCSQMPLTWLQLVFNVPKDGLVLDQAMAAVTLSVVGRASNNPVLAVESSRKYGQALWELQRALWDERVMYKDETLAACMALVFYEVCSLNPLIVCLR